MVRLSGRGEDDFREEIEAHIALETDRLVEEGHSPEEAAVFARRKFGNVTRTQERYYESRRLAWLTHLFRDARDAVRDMKRQPTSTAAILLSLTIGIGASVSIFSLADQSLFRPLPVIEPGQIVQLRWNGRFIGGGSGFGNLLPHPFYRELRNAQDVFVDMLARSQTEAVLAIGSQSETITVEVASGSYFPTFGVLPAVGRLLTDQDDLSIGAHPVVVLSYDYWQHRFGGDPTIVGQRIRINDHPMTIIGVAQSGFRGTDWSHPSALWIPLTMNGFVRNRSRRTERRERFLHVFARMRDGTSIAQAEAQLQPWFANYLRAETELPGWPAVTAGQLNEYLSSRLDVVPAARGQARETQIEQPMIVLVFATGLCLLLASLNVANLSIARTLARRKTIALRMALGASRARILSSQLVESSMLVLFGSVLGVLVAPLISSGILTLLPNGTGAGEMGLRAGVDVRVLVAALITAVS